MRLRTSQLLKYCGRSSFIMVVLYTYIMPTQLAWLKLVYATYFIWTCHTRRFMCMIYPKNCYHYKSEIYIYVYGMIINLSNRSITKHLNFRFMFLRYSPNTWYWLLPQGNIISLCTLFKLYLLTAIISRTIEMIPHSQHPRPYMHQSSQVTGLTDS